MIGWLALACSLQAGPAGPPGAPPRDRALERELRASAGPGARWVNRLATERSPYLRAHATDPVDWRPWGDDALAVARELDRPILLSIGYATCHWCHVMQEESFRDEEIARLVNEGFVPVLVDREERPDLDQIYLRAVTELVGRAGWPLTLVLTPDGDVVLGATYLPARDGDRGAARGLLGVLTTVRDGWRDDRARLVAEAHGNSLQVVAAAAPRPAGSVPDADAVRFVVDQLRATYDPEHGGFGGPPQFPRPAALELLLARGDRAEVRRTLDAILDGGVHDLLGGGFHRYAVDAAWQIPHFEKMTEDNALLAATLVDASAALSEPRYAAAARETLRSLDALALPGGGYGTGLDADSLGPDGARGEGRWATWTAAELAEVLGPSEGARAAAAFGVVDPGPVEGRSALRSVAPIDPAWLGPLRAARAARPPPALDDKWLVAVNARVVTAAARAAARSPDPAARAEARARALAASERLRDAVLPDGRAPRGSTRDEAGVLDDQALLAEAWLELFELTADPAWLDRAIAVAAAMDARYADPAGGWFRSPDDRATPLYRPRDESDPGGASGLAVATRVCQRLAELTGDRRWQERADAALASVRPSARWPAMAEALAERWSPPPTIVLSWPDGADTEPLWAVIRSTFVPGRIVVAAPAPELAALASRVPLVADKVATAPTAWVCRAGVCQAPATTADALAAALR